jgi:hypothetical protein
MIIDQVKSLPMIVPAGAVKRLGRPLGHIHMHIGYVGDQ